MKMVGGAIKSQWIALYSWAPSCCSELLLHIGQTQNMSAEIITHHMLRDSLTFSHSWTVNNPLGPL